MGAEVKWKVVYEIPSQHEGWWYGVTAQEAMEVCKDNGPLGAKPLYAYRESQPDIIFEWGGYGL